MSINKIKPLVSRVVTERPYTEEIYSHDAYGVITMTVVHGGNSTLFGSDIDHNDRVRIGVSRAKLNRHLSHDWVHADLLPLVEFEMSHAQFAQFITGAGNGSGSGTPVTLRYGPEPGVKSVRMPDIELRESKHETFKREIKAAAEERLEAIERQIAELGEMLESGKTPKGELRRIHATLRRHAEQLPDSLGFVVGSAEEALEKATSDAKIEVEAYIETTMRAAGLEHLFKPALTHEEK
jgi:hypothetical protein